MNADHTSPTDSEDFNPSDFNPGMPADAQTELEETRRRIADAPASVVVVNHVMGLYELATIHLSAKPPRLDEAVLAIDAVTCLVEGLGERLGDEYPTICDALSNIRLAFVQIKGSQAGGN